MTVHPITCKAVEQITMLFHPSGRANYHALPPILLFRLPDFPTVSEFSVQEELPDLSWISTNLVNLIFENKDITVFFQFKIHQTVIAGN